MHMNQTRKHDDNAGPELDLDHDDGAITSEVARFRHQLAHVEPHQLSDEDLLYIQRLTAKLAALLGED